VAIAVGTIICVAQDLALDAYAANNNNNGRARQRTAENDDDAYYNKNNNEGEHYYDNENEADNDYNLYYEETSASEVRPQQISTIVGTVGVLEILVNSLNLQVMVHCAKPLIKVALIFNVVSWCVWPLWDFCQETRWEAP
jgi:hypothetical protein